MEKLTAMKNNMSKKTREKVAKAGLIVNTTAMMMVLNMTSIGVQGVQTRLKRNVRFESK